MPFLLHSLPPEDRGTMTQEMPRQVTEELVPIVWREQEALLAPFLLIEGVES